MAKEAEVEFIRYRTKDISEATVALISTLVRFSDIEGIGLWVSAIIPLLEIIKDEKPQEYVVNAPGIELFFSGFPGPIPTIIKEDLVYRSREPRFTFYNKSLDVSPKERTKIGRVSEYVAEEISNVYHVGVERNPLSIIFVKPKFAKKREVFNAPLLPIT